MRYTVIYIHKISPQPSKDRQEADIAIDLSIPQKPFIVALALRRAGLLPPGTRVREVRVEGDKVIVFPRNTIWHSLVISKL